jgi:hypothetical protein
LEQKKRNRDKACCNAALVPVSALVVLAAYTNSPACRPYDVGNNNAVAKNGRALKGKSRALHDK